MMRKLPLLLPLLICLFVVIIVYDTTHISKEEYHELIENHPIQKRLHLSKNERKKLGLPPNRYFDDQYLLEMDPATGETYPENIEAVINESKENKNIEDFFSLAPGESKNMAWRERGPDNIGGRTRVVFYDPNDVTGKRVFAGGVSGGLWLNNDITDENSTWVQVGISENLSITCYVIDPNDSNIWYVGTGESYTDSAGTGRGIWRSTDGGATWSNYIATNFNREGSRRVYYTTQLLAWNNKGTTELFASLDGQFDVDPVGFLVSGWWRIDGGSRNKIKFLNDEKRSYVFSDIEIAADNSIWFATKHNIYGNGGGKVFRTIDGENFTEKYSFTNGGRTELAVSKQNANTVYALCSVDNNSAVSMVKTIDGTRFTNIALPNDADANIPAHDFARRQGFYNLTLEVDLNNDAILYGGGIDLFRSTNSGSSWDQISKWSNNNNLRNLNVSLVHGDQHAVVIDPNNSENVIFANDGGIYYTSNISNAFNSSTAITSRNKGYNITQLYSAAIGQDEENEIFLAGAQDNGSLFVQNAQSNVNSFKDIYGGDGAHVFIDKDGKYVIASYVYNIYSCFALPYSEYDNGTRIVSDSRSGDFINIADLDDNKDILYANATLGTTERIARYSNLGTTPSISYFTSAELFENPTAIKVSPFTMDSSTVFIGTEGATLLKVTNFDTSNPTWTNIDVSGSINAGSISDIDFGASENEILVTLHNYGVSNIYYTDDGGVTWSVKDGDFRDIPVKAIQMSPLNSDEVIIGTNAGVWRTENFMSDNPHWIQSQNGMSSVKVTDLDMRTSDNTVLASTYGRGLFTGMFVDDSDRVLSDLDDKVLLSASDIGSKSEQASIFDNITIADNVLTLSNVKTAFDISVFTMNGKKIIQQKIDPLQGITQYINAYFQSGIYILQISYKGNASTKKVIIN